MNSQQIVILDDEEEEKIEFSLEKDCFNLFHDLNYKENSSFFSDLLKKPSLSLENEENSFFFYEPLKKPSPSFTETLKTEENTPCLPLKSINSKRKRFFETDEWPVFLGSFALPCAKKQILVYDCCNSKYNKDTITIDDKEIEVIPMPLNDYIQILSKGKVKHGLTNPDTYIKVSEDEKIYFSHYFSQIWHFLLNFDLVKLKAKIMNNYIKIDVFLTNKANINNFKVENVLLNCKLPNDDLLNENARLHREQEIVKYCKESIIILFDMLNIKKIMSSLIVLKKKVMFFTKKYSNRSTYYPSICHKPEQIAYYGLLKKVDTSNCGIYSILFNRRNKSDIETENETINKENEKDEKLNEENQEKNDKNKEYLHFLDSTKFNSQIPPKEMTTNLHEYQQQALKWLLFRENCIEIEQLYKNFDKKNEKFRQLNCLYEEYELLNGKRIYLNIFKGEVSLDPPKNKFCKGGILADEMGLGKTIMMLALIHTNKGNSEITENESSDSDTEKRQLFPLKPNIDENCRKKREIIKKKTQTLIVTPLTILDQWKTEILSHSMPNSLKVGTFYGDSRKDFLFEDYDIILTTYDVLAQAHKVYKKDNQDNLKNKLYITRIFTFQWFRVIIDEAHNIKNRKSQRAEACYSLQSQYRWCLTGTPLQNHLDDLYSLLKFLKVEILGEEYTWWNTYVNNSKDSLNVLKHIVGPILLRRTKKSLDKNGLPILKLSGKNIEVVKVLMGEDEKKIYDDLFLRSRDKFRLFMKNGVIMQKYSGIFAMLMKLRRCCDHPSLILNKIDNDIIDSELKNFLFDRKALEIEEINQENNLLNPFKGKEFYEEVVNKIKNGEFPDCSICMSDMIEPALSKCCHVLCFECFTKSIELNSHCPICRKFLGLNDICKIFR